MLKTTNQLRREAKQLFRFCVVNGVLDEARARHLVQRILQTRRRGYLALLKNFRRWVRFDFALHTATIESATPLPVDLQDSVRAGLRRVYRQRVGAQFTLNPALIGGIRIRVGSDVYDGSVQSELAAVEKSFGISTAKERILRI